MNTKRFWKAILVGTLGFSLVAPVLAADETRPSQPDAGKAEAKLPSAQEILERYQKAIGGKDAFKKHTSQRALGAVELAAQGIKGSLEVYAARPNKLYMKSTLPGVGDLHTGFNGKVGWMSSALTGPMLLQGKSLEQISTQADFDQSLHDITDYKTATVLGTEDFNGEECYKLRLIHRTGFDTTEFFSKKSGLQLGFIATQDSPLGPVTATTKVEEYKQFGDLYMPSKITQKAAGMETVMTISKMEYDNVDPSIFEVPADVKALLEAPAPKATNAPAAQEKPGKTPQK